MPRAEIGSVKYLNNKMKAKGLQRLRWYCQVCERQMRDENGFKQHTQSESHVRAMLLIGEDPRKHIQDYSNQFKRDFLQLLRTSHGEKKVNLNKFYNEYIANKEHIHMNATRWPSLTEFGKYLGREGICRVEEGERGFEISWIDDSPEALRRQEAIRKKERQERGDEQREQKMLEQQVERARREAEAKAQANAEAETEVNEAAPEDAEAKPQEPIKITFGLGKLASSKPPSLPTELPKDGSQTPAENTEQAANGEAESKSPASTPAPAFKMSLGGASKRANVFKAARKNNPLAEKKAPKVEQPKKMSNAERIMREELERKRLREERGSTGGGFKRQRLG